MADVSARLLSIRTILNVAAIFTDVAKIHQAAGIAYAISGPYAPVVAPALLIAWAIAESTIDVYNLMQGDEVYFFKQGKNWDLSIEGLVEKAVNEGINFLVDGVTGAINERISDASSAVQQLENQAIYQAYQSVSEGTSAAINAGSQVIEDWAKNVEINGGEGAQALSDSGINAISEGSNTLSKYADDFEADSKDWVILQSNQFIQNASNSIQNTVSEFADQLADSIAATITSGFSAYLPSGQVINTGTNNTSVPGFNVKLSYVDYMRIFLLFTGNTTKVRRIQSLVQANLRYGMGNTNFSMAGSFGSVAATLKCSIDYLMLGNAVMPLEIRQNGKMQFTVYSNRSY